MVASVILNCEPLIGLTKMVEKSNSNKSKVNGEEERRDVVGLLVSKTRRRTVEVLELGVSIRVSVSGSYRVDVGVFD